MEPVINFFNRAIAQLLCRLYIPPAGVGGYIVNIKQGLHHANYKIGYSGTHRRNRFIFTCCRNYACAGDKQDHLNALAGKSFAGHLLRTGSLTFLFPNHTQVQNSFYRFLHILYAYPFLFTVKSMLAGEDIWTRQTHK